jgi:hypothetical protein
LAFEWDKTPRGPGKKYIGQISDGRLMFRFVEHPGIEPRPYIFPAWMEKKGEIAEAIGTTFRVEIGRGQKKRTILA